MQSRRRWERQGVMSVLTAVSTGALFLLSGCGPKEESAPPASGEKAAGRAASGAGGESPVLAKLPAPQLVKNEELLEREGIKAEAAAMLERKDFAGLDERGRELRKNHRIDADGSNAIRGFYDGLEEVPKKAPDSEYEARMALLKEWIQARPDSVAPRIALAGLMVDYAWKARGTGYANTVTKEGFRLMAERLKKAREILFEARSLEEKCPRWWGTAQSVALGEGWDPATYDKMYEEGLAAYPTNYRMCTTKAYHLQPRWYGKPGEWEAYAESAADRLGGEEGDMLYARIIWSINGLGMYNNIFKETKVKWDRVKKSFRALEKKYPDSLAMHGAFARIACNAGDWATAREQFEHIGGRVDSKEWDDVEEFVRFRKDAYTHR